ncbi:hypothetical protein [Exiguobacterium sp. s78]|uniref:hypothetical protein n=1 Tax=Exiguobacterium sp. s78 TaxID=2751197 RepID=UPI001BEBD7C7|nr:hypothetical protein [Exiguobacterium sp. s78]
MSVEHSSKSIEELESQIERMDTKVADLTSKVELLQSLLTKIIKDQEVNPDLLTDIEYVMLKNDLSAEERAEVSFFLIQTQKEYKFEQKVPSLSEFHNGLLKTLSIEAEEQNNYPIEISKRLIKEHIELDVFPVGNEILNKN